jgi:hypothetical protein
MADEIAQSSPGGGMGFREGQVTNATKRGECHKWMMFMKELVVELLNVFMKFLEELGAGRNST